MKKNNRGIVKHVMAISSCLTIAGLSGCNSTSVADTVVYGKIYTANSKQEYVEALAIKDGKYIYVGNKDEAAKYVKSGMTKVVNYNDGFIMPGATEGHGHYIMISTLTALNLIKTTTTVDGTIDFISDVIEKTLHHHFI